MSAPIGPGDWIERDPAYPGSEHAIDRSEITFTAGSYPDFGQVFQVRSMHWRRCPASGVAWEGVRLVGIVANVPEAEDAVWPLDAFRPVYRPRADLIEQLKQPAPERELADA